MPRISPLAKASATLAACAEAVSDANGLNSSTLSNLSSRMKSYSGFGEGVCTCARCMRRAGPIREDVENKLVQITYALANVYDDSPDLEVRVTDAHRQRAEEMMACVESGDITRLREMFLEVEEQESEGLLEGGTATEIATYLIISAAQVGQPEVIRLLAEWDADMEETDSIRRGRPLMHAANNGHTAAVKALVDCGAEPEATDDNGYTALMVAVFSDRSSAAEALVDGGACVDAQDRAGRTALSYAAMYGSTDCIYLLAARGADVAHMDHDGNTPLELAEGSGRQSAVDALKKLQLRVKMQEKRKVKQSKSRPGCSDLDAAQLEAKEQEAARAAAELLEQLEKEEAAKTAKAAKKKKKGKGKAASQDCAASDTTDCPQQEADHLPTANGVHDSHAQPQHSPSARQRKQQQQPPGHSQDSSATWPAQDLRGGTAAEHDDSAASKAADSKQPRKQAKQAASTSPGGSCKQAAVGVAGDAAQQQQSAVHVATADDTASSVDSAGAGDAELDVLRRDWEALVEQAARCKDQRQQPTMLARVADMLSRCSDAGISVKYGRKVLQRLQAVGPARTALQAALATQPCSIDELEAALAASKSCRCLLEDELLQLAEDVLANLLKEQEELRQRQEAEQQARIQQEQQQRQQLLKAQQQAEAQRHQQLAAQQQQQAQQQQAQQQQAQQQQQQQVQQQQQQQAPWPANPGAGSMEADSPVAAPQQHRDRAGLGLAAQAYQQHSQHPQQHVSQSQMQPQEVQHMQQQVQQVVQQMAQALPQPTAQQHQQHPLVQQAQQRPLQQQQVQPVQPQQHMAVQHQPPGTTMPFLQQQLRALQPQMQQPPHSMQMQRQQQQHLNLLAQQPPHTAPVSTALPVPSLLAGQQQQQQQQHSLSQLQLLQQQQQLFASQQQHPLSQLQRGPIGAGMLVGTPPLGLAGPGGMSLPGQLLPPMSQAAVRLQQAQQMQHQQLANSYWGPRPSLVASGGSFGSVGQPMARSPAAGGRLSMELLGPQPGIPNAAGLSATAGELARRSSLGTPAAVAAPVLLPSGAEVDVLDDHQHPAYAMANALLSDDEDQDNVDAVVNPVVECRMCFKAGVNTCCLPCGCLLMCQGCALLWKQRGEVACPWCKAPLEDFAVL